MEERKFYRDLTTGDIYVVELVDSECAVLNDGVRRSIVSTENFQDKFYDASEELEVKPFQHQITIGNNQASNTEVMNVFNSLATQALALTRRQHTPFEVLAEEDRNKSKPNFTEFKNAIGFWHSAIPFIDQDEDENGELYAVVRMVLDGYVFAPRLMSYFDISDERMEEETDLSSLVEIVPRFLHIGDDEETQVLRTEFDFIVHPEGELPSVDAANEEEVASADVDDGDDTGDEVVEPQQ